MHVIWGSSWHSDTQLGSVKNRELYNELKIYTLVMKKLDALCYKKLSYFRTRSYEVYSNSVVHFYQSATIDYTPSSLSPIYTLTS